MHGEGVADGIPQVASTVEAMPRSHASLVHAALVMTPVFYSRPTLPWPQLTMANGLLPPMPEMPRKRFARCAAAADVGDLTGPAAPAGPRACPDDATLVPCVILEGSASRTGPATRCKCTWQLGRGDPDVASAHEKALLVSI